jgi:hypothetical protein
MPVALGTGLSGGCERVSVGSAVGNRWQNVACFAEFVPRFNDKRSFSRSGLKSACRWHDSALAITQIRKLR